MRLNDLDFHVEMEGSGPDLVVLHGFTGSVRAWDDVRPKLAAASRVISIDLIGHGDSAVPDEPGRYSLEWSARDLAALLDRLELRTVHLLGYSMGGRVALHFAVHAPERLRSIILESASPGIADAAERDRRAASDAALADRICENGVEAFVAEWEAQPLLEPAPQVSAAARERQRSQRLRNRPVGLANSLRGMGAGQQQPLWSRLGALSMPVLLIVGERDQRYREIAARTLASLPSAELAAVLEAGHTVHLDQPEAFVGLVKNWVESKSRN
jgi:2-succinyl-6-hydroxy-2,4-cyclohexadiene-1-carboxylate synthase